MNFGVGSAYSKSPGFASSEGTGPGTGAVSLYKVCQLWEAMHHFSLLR